jgi:hypothetical protein
LAIIPPKEASPLSAPFETFKASMLIVASGAVSGRRFHVQVRHDAATGDHATLIALAMYGDHTTLAAVFKSAV